MLPISGGSKDHALMGLKQKAAHTQDKEDARKKVIADWTLVRQNTAEAVAVQEIDK